MAYEIDPTNPVHVLMEKAASVPDPHKNPLEFLRAMAPLLTASDEYATVLWAIDSPFGQELYANRRSTRLFIEYVEAIDNNDRINHADIQSGEAQAMLLAVEKNCYIDEFYEYNERADNAGINCVPMDVDSAYNFINEFMCDTGDSCLFRPPYARNNFNKIVLEDIVVIDKEGTVEKFFYDDPEYNGFYVRYTDGL